MSKQILDMFNEETKALKLDKQFVLRVKKFSIGFMTKNLEHIRFFGDILIGANKIVWSQEDRNEFFEDTLDGLDFLSIRAELASCEAINTKFKVSSDVTNNTIMYLVYKLSKNTGLSPALNKEAQLYLLYIMHYRFLCSLQTHYFPHLADESISRAASSTLSNQYLLKQCGSWQKWIDRRCEEILKIPSLHSRTLTLYNDDTDVIEMINDIQGRVRQTYKYLAKVFHDVHEGNNRITSTSAMLETEDGMIVKDQSNGFVSFLRYIHDTVSDSHSFIRTELVDVIVSINTTMPKDSFVESLDYVSDNYATKRSKILEPIINELIVHALNYVTAAKLPLNDLKGVIIKLKSIYTSSRTEDVKLLEIKASLDKELKNAIPARRYTAIPSIRTGVMLYVVLRTLTMKYYSS